MKQSIVGGLIGAMVMCVTMSVLGATHQAPASSTDRKLDQLRALMVMSHSKEIRDFMKPVMEWKKGDDKKVITTFAPFLAAMEDLGNDNDEKGAAVYYVLSGKYVPDKPEGK